MLKLRIDWIALLDKLKARLGLNDTELAGVLDISRSMLAQVRSGNRQLPTKVRLVVLDKLGYAVTRGTVLASLPNDLQEAITEADNRRAQDRAALKACSNFLEDEFNTLSPNARKLFLDRVCILGGCDRKTLAALMEVQPSELREIERGERKMHFLARSAIYENFDAVELTDVIEQVLPQAD